MKKTLLYLFFCALFPLLASAQSLDFDKINRKTNIQAGWSKSSPAGAFADSLTKRSGNYSLCVNGDKAEDHCAYVVTRGNLSYVGDTAYLSGYVKAGDLAGCAKISFSSFGKSGPQDHIASEYFALSSGAGNDWVGFKLKLALCPETTIFQILCGVNGTGKVWIDDFELTIDGKPIAEAVKKPAQNIKYKADDDKQFDNGSGFVLPEQLSASQVENLNALARVWGLLKYYHPAVARGDYNWDYELFRILPRVYNAPVATRNKILLQWVESLGAFETYAGKPNEGVSWVGDTKRFGAKLSKKLTEVSVSKRLPFHYYYRSVNGMGQASFYHEASYSDMSYDDAGMRLLGVFRLWNAIEFFYPYRYMTDDRDEMLSEALLAMSAPEVNSKSEYLVALRRIICGIHDSHGVVYDTKQSVRSRFTHAVPIITDKLVEGKFIVAQSFGKPGEENLLQYDAITHKDGHSVADILEKYKYMSSASNSNKLAQSIAGSVPYITDKEIVKYTVDRGGNIIEVEAKAYPLEEWATMYPRYTSEAEPAHKIYEDSVAYINIKIDAASLKKISNEYFSYPRLVIDARGYPAQGVFEVLSELLPRKVYASARFRYPDPIRPGNFIEGVNFGNYFVGANDRKTKVVVVVDHNTQSQAEHLTMMLQNIPGMVTLGSQTSGADGDITSIGLPGDMEAIFTGLDWFYPDGSRCQGVGVRIDEVVTPTLKGVREGRDEQLERAMEILRQ